MEKIFTCIKNIGVWHSFEKMKPQLCFFLKKTFPSLSGNCGLLSYVPVITELEESENLNQG